MANSFNDYSVYTFRGTLPILRDGKIASVLIGASKSSQIIENINAIKNTTFTDDELKKIDDNSL